jgi:hypothetical protein
MAYVLRYLLLLSLIITFLYGCKKYVDAGIKTTVSGMVFDPNNQQPIAGVPILVQEYEPGFYSARFIGNVDSTISDAAGRYSLTFTTTGKGSQYKVGVRLTANYYALQGAVGVNPGKDTSITFRAMALKILKAQVKVINNPNPPLRVSATANLGKTIYGRNNDTTVYLMIFPNRDNYIQFTITNPDTPSRYNYRIDTLHLPGFADTFTRTFQVDPRFLPKKG